MFFGRTHQLAAVRQQALDAGFQAHPERFVRGRPKVRLPPPTVAINPIDPGAPTQSVAEVLAADAPPATPAPATPAAPKPMLPGLAREIMVTNCS